MRNICWLGFLMLCPGMFGADAEVIHFTPGPEVELAVQEAFILAEPGTEFVFAEGRYAFKSGLSLDVENAAIRGAGMDKTVWTFAGQDAGSEGLYVTGSRVTLEDFAIEDTKGNAFKSNGADHLTVRRVRTEWTGGPKESNGAYGLYPVNSQYVIIDGCVAIGASDAGIYVGQSRDIIVRNSTARLNVAGIEIENCYRADVYNNTATENTGGVLVFDLPGLPQQGGHQVRVFDNKIVGNNTRNFAPAGNIVAQVPPGTGIMVMANRDVEIFGNTLEDNKTTHIALCSYYITRLEIQDEAYYPYPEGIRIRNNHFGKGGHEPSGPLGALARLALGVPLPDIFWDGVVNDEREGTAPIFSIHSNEKPEGAVAFASVNGRTALENPAAVQVNRDASAFAAELPPLPAVSIPEAKP